MTPTDEQRRRVHDITYSTEDREELAERIVALEDERDKLRRERDLYSALVEELAERIVALEDERDLYSSLVEDMDHPDTANQLRAENARLRELLKNALTYIEYEGCGVECPETGHGATLTPCDTCNRYETESCAYVIAQSARELEAEVD